MRRRRSPTRRRAGQSCSSRSTCRTARRSPTRSRKSPRSRSVLGIVPDAHGFGDLRPARRRLDTRYARATASRSRGRCASIRRRPAGDARGCSAGRAHRRGRRRRSAALMHGALDAAGEFRDNRAVPEAAHRPVVRALARADRRSSRSSRRSRDRRTPPSGRRPVARRGRTRVAARPRTGWSAGHAATSACSRCRSSASTIATAAKRRTRGLDCSGLIRYVFQQVTGVTLPRTAQEMSRLGKDIRAGRSRARRPRVLQHPALRVLARRHLPRQRPLHPRAVARRRGRRRVARPARTGRSATTARAGWSACCPR